jgi:hypothetical protein
LRCKMLHPQLGSWPKNKDKDHSTLRTLTKILEDLMSKKCGTSLPQSAGWNSHPSSSSVESAWPSTQLFWSLCSLEQWRTLLKNKF